MKNKIILGFALLIVATVLVGGCSLVISGGWTVSDGSRNGYLQKFGSKGNFYKTYEGELALHGGGGSQVGKTGQAGAAVSNTWAFSVEDQSVIDFLKKIQDSDTDERKAVTLFYVEYLFSGWFDTSYRVTKVKWLSDPDKKQKIEPNPFTNTNHE